MSDPGFKTNLKLLGRIVYNNVFTPAECEKILAYTENSTNEAYVKDGVLDHSVRNTRTKKLNLLPENLWIQERIYNIALKVNQSYYHFNIGGLGELHVLEYEKDCFYNWHIDITSDPNNCTRKISIILFLSDPSDYDGGKLSWSLNSEPDTLNVTQELGSMILFPSFLPHKVTPVKRGIRRALVCWIHGDSFM
jgi:PKHD-type hydroxylase